MYLLHFEQTIEHAGHYLGSTENLKRRMTEHANGTAARLTQVLCERGIHWRLAALWQCRLNCREVEALTKRTKNGHSYCPICHGENARTPKACFPVPHPNFTSKELRHEQ